MGVRVHHGQRLEQPLRVLVGLQDRFALGPGQQTRERAPVTLRGMDRLRLRRPSSIVSTRHRFSSSSSISAAVVVSAIITGPSTRYSWVTSLPVAGSLVVEAIVSSPSLCRSFRA